MIKPIFNHISQVSPQASILQSDSCFLLKREGKNYLWNGKVGVFLDRGEGLLLPHKT